MTEQKYKSCPVFEDCVAERIQADDRLALSAALLQWDRYRWPLKLMSVLGKLLLKYRVTK